MRLIDKSPALFILLAYLVVYSVIGVEMWTSATVAAVALTLFLIASIAACLCAWMFHVLDEATTTKPAVVANADERPAAPALQPAPARRTQRVHPREAGLAG
jgi:hypothetical protein